MTDETFYSTHIDERGIATLTMNRPEVHNAFDDAFIAGLSEELQRIDALSEVRVVVLAAAGKSFSAGADLNWMRRMAGYTRDQNYADSMKLAGLMETLNRMRRPTIARVQGAAFGGGVGLVACCDMAVASEKASFCLSEVKLGLIPAVISPYVVTAMGERQARRYFLTAERFGAEEARRIGLVHEVVTPEALDERVETLCSALLQNGPEAVGEAKRLARDVARGPVDQGMIEDTSRRIADIRVSPEGQEGLAAFLEKRQPAWRQDTGGR